ncbi:hypothetical protein [Rhodoblastus sp.]|uniref:hypothetical protein n=1 Tax=Rhodoblastus sp. TaxID=1962975 RepID=UPI0025DC02D9|nr:hypothetical protein [Rhodoblastus sp.]
MHGQMAVNFIIGNSIGIRYDDYLSMDEFDFYISAKFISHLPDFSCPTIPHRLTAAENCFLREDRGAAPRCEKYRVFRKTTGSVDDTSIGGAMGFYVPDDLSDLKNTWKQRRVITKGGAFFCHPDPERSTRLNDPPAGYVELRGADALRFVVGNTLATIGEAPVYYPSAHAACKRDGDHASLEPIDLTEKQNCGLHRHCAPFRVFKKQSVNVQRAAKGATPL